MRPVSGEALDELESLTLEGVKQIRAYFKYEGTNQVYLKKAQLSAAVIGSYTRLRASETNRMAVELAARREEPAPARILNPASGAKGR